MAGEHRALAAPLERLRETNPVRLALYPVAVAVVALLVWYGLVAEQAAPLWLALVAAALSAAGTEAARASVDSPRTVAERERDAYAHGVEDAVRMSPDLTATRRAAQRGGAIE